MTETGENSKKPVVLIIEDNSATAELFTEMLSDHEIPAASVSTGAQAIAFLSDYSPELVLLDYSLPDMEGIQLVEKVKMPPFIVITGHGDEQVAVEMMKKGATDYLVKTSRLIEELPLIVSRTLQRLTLQRELIDAREEAKSATERFELAMETTRDGIWDWDLTNRTAYYSPAYEKMLGYQQGVFANTPQGFLPYIHPDEQKAVKEKINQLITGPADHYTNEFRLKDKDGGWHWILSRASCVKRGPNGRALRIIGTHIDITEDKKMEKFLRLAMKKAHLLNNRAETDLMNQVYMIRGYLSLLSEGELSEESASNIERISSLIKGIESRITFIRSYESLGTEPPEWIDVNLHMVMALSHHPYLSYLSGMNNLEILADPLVEQVFTSLVQTSFSHAGSSLSTIRLSMKKADKSVTIVYEDDGEGILEEHKESVFEFGYGEKQSAGLFLAREILDITGIEIRENGVFHSGCRFELRVPEGRFRIKQENNSNHS